MLSDENPHPGDIRHGQIHMGCLTPPLLLRLDIDRCILFRGNSVIISYFRVSRHDEQSKQHFLSNFGEPNMHVKMHFVSRYISFGS